MDKYRWQFVIRIYDYGDKYEEYSRIFKWCSVEKSVHFRCLKWTILIGWFKWNHKFGLFKRVSCVGGWKTNDT